MVYLKRRFVRIVATIVLSCLVLDCFGVFDPITVEAAKVYVKPIQEQVVSVKSVKVGKVDYDNGYTGQPPMEYCKIKTTKVFWVRGDMAGQPKEGTDMRPGDTINYVLDDKKTKRTEEINVSLTVGYGVISADVSVPINIFKKNGSSKSGVLGASKAAQEPGTYKLYGKVKYQVTTYYTYCRPDTRKVSKAAKKKYGRTKYKWKKLCQYKSAEVEVLRDSSYLRKV